MNRKATWKVLTVGAALTGLGVAGAGAAHADVEPVALAAHPANVQLAVDVPQIEGPVQLNIPQEFHGLYDSADSGSWWDS